MSNTLADYHLWLVLLSVVLSTFAAFSGLLIAEHIRRPGGGINPLWLVLASVVLGGGAVWSMHFIGMVAFRPGVPITYDLQLTVISLLLPVVLFGAGLFTVSRWTESTAALLIAGTLLGLGVAAMHYTGMAGLRIQADMTHSHGLMAVSIVIALVASTVALYVVRSVRDGLRWLAAPVMGFAVSGMHYTGMAAMRITPSDKAVSYFDGALTSQSMLVLVLLAVTVVCLVRAYLALAETRRRDGQLAGAAGAA